MKKKNVALALAASVTLLFGAGSAFAADAKKCYKNGKQVACKVAKAKKPKAKAVPEIDATSGGQALALVLGVGLLGAERLRRSQRAR
jgi:hypothetical protein